MKTILTLITATLAFNFSVSAQEPKFNPLFNGKDLSGWKVPENNIWYHAEDGILKIRSGPKKKGSILWTEKEFADFIVEVDFRFGEGVVDSGVHLRNMDQIQIGISGSLKRDMTASPYIPGKGYPVEAEGVADLLKMKDWNHLKTEVRGMTYTCWLNGKKVMTYTSDTGKAKGPIGLQLHGGKIMSIDFRNIKLAELSTKSAAAGPKKKRVPNPAFAKVEDIAGLPRVLLIGDSISMGYTVPVRNLLKGKANVHRIPTNGGPTTRGLSGIDKWLGDKKWDIIHFNWGIHDLRYLKKGDAETQVNPANYERNLRKLIAKLKATGAKLIWASITPIPEPPLIPDRNFNDEQEYNKIAARVMTENHIPINDLHSYVAPRFKELQKKQDLHYKPEGYQFLAKKVAAEIEKAIE